MEVKIKKLTEDAVIPTYSKPGDAGMDLVATSKFFDKYGNVVYGTGLAFEIPEGYVGLVFPRSSISKYDLELSNHVGVIDSGYRGEVLAKFKPTLAYMNFGATDNENGIGEDTDFFDYVGIIGDNHKDSYEPKLYEIGDRIAQIIIVPYPKISFIQVDELSTSERGEGGFGHTGN